MRMLNLGTKRVKRELYEKKEASLSIRLTKISQLEFLHGNKFQLEE